MIYIMMPESRITAIAICFAAGIAAAAYLHPIVWLALAAMSALGVPVIAKNVKRSTVMIAAVAFVLGAAHYCVGREIPQSDVSRFVFHINAFEGTVASDPENGEGRTRLICKVARVKSGDEWVSACGQVMVNIYSDETALSPKLDYGDRVRIDTNAYPPQDPTNPGQFSWKGYLARQYIYSCAYVKNASQLHVIERGQGNILLLAALKSKHYIERSIAKITPEREASVMTGMVLGTYSYLPRETLANFGKTGTLHLLAASGYNCFILLFFATPILKLTGLMPKYRSAVVIFLLIMYMLMVGMKPSLIRASVMASAFLIAPLLKRVPSIKTVFFAAGFGILAINPSYLFDVGFQLSFLAVWALISISPVVESILVKAGVINQTPFKRRAGLLQKISSEIAGAGVATLSVTLFTAPVIAYYFNYFSIVSLPANMALALGVPVVFAGGMLAPIVAPIPVVGTAVGWVGGKVTSAMLGIVDYLGSWHYSSVAIASPGVLAVVGYYIVLYAALSYVRSKVAA
ncbi:MAG: ComEC/Rec2 family competence protein [Armatimonadota bacterium]|nr:ComEC family competence protein [bacterium]